MEEKEKISTYSVQSFGDRTVCVVAINLFRFHPSLGRPHGETESLKQTGADR